MFYRPSPASPYRVGFSTRKKYKNAVARNRARRLMKESFRLHQKEIKSGFDYVFIWIGPIEGLPLAQIERRMLSILKKGGLLKS